MDDVDDFLRNHYCPADVAPPEPNVPDATDTGGSSHQPNLAPVGENHPMFAQSGAQSARPVEGLTQSGANPSGVTEIVEPFANLDPNQLQGKGAETSAANLDLEQEENHAGCLEPNQAESRSRGHSYQTHNNSNQTHNKTHGTGFARPVIASGRGCVGLVKVFLDHVNVREGQNFKTRREENQNSVTLTTMHQSKGLEWDNVFVVKVNDNETPLLHEEVHGRVEEGAASLEVRNDARFTDNVSDDVRWSGKEGRNKHEDSGFGA